MALTDEQIKDAIRQAGGIVHSDGNIFFTNVGMFQAAARAVESAVLAGMEKDAQRYRWLRNPTRPVAVLIDGQLPFSVDAVIDAAISATQESQHAD